MKNTLLEKLLKYLEIASVNFSVLTGGDVNETYKIQTPKETIVIRINDGSEKDKFLLEEACLKQASLLGIPSPKVISVGEFEGKGFMVLEFIEGKSGPDIEISNQIAVWKQLGSYVKKINSVQELKFGTETLNSTIAEDHFRNKYLQYNIDELNKGDDFFIVKNYISESEKHQILELFQNLKQIDFEFGLVHGDISLVNCILSDQKLYLIDWGSAEINYVPFYEINLAYLNLLINKISADNFDGFLEGMNLTPDFISKNLKTINGLLALYLMDKMRWAKDWNHPDQFNEYLEKFLKIKPKLLN